MSLGLANADDLDRDTLQQRRLTMARALRQISGFVNRDMKRVEERDSEYVSSNSASA